MGMLFRFSSEDAEWGWSNRGRKWKRRKGGKLLRSSRDKYKSIIPKSRCKMKPHKYPRHIRCIKIPLCPSEKESPTSDSRTGQTGGQRKARSSQGPPTRSRRREKWGGKSWGSHSHFPVVSSHILKLTFCGKGRSGPSGSCSGASFKYYLCTV